jgi:hypothetical protein
MRRSRWWLVTLMMAAGFIVVLLNTTEHRVLAADRVGEQRRGDPERARIEQGFAIAPVTLHFRRNLRDQVGLGSYLVNTGGCNDCHTNPSYAPGHDPFLGQPEQINTEGYLGGGQQFGPFTSRNITPDENGLPGGLTWDEFRNMMRTGVDPEQAHPQISPLLQVMPWPVFGKKTDYELRAIYEYLKAIPSVAGEPGE